MGYNCFFQKLNAPETLTFHKTIFARFKKLPILLHCLPPSPDWEMSMPFIYFHIKFCMLLSDCYVQLEVKWGAWVRVYSFVVMALELVLII